MNPFVIRAVGIAMVFAAGWMVNGWRLGQQIAGMDRDQAVASEMASEMARLKERYWGKQVEEARNAAQERDTRLRADAERARTESERLRGDLAAIRKQLPSLTDAAVRRYAGVAGELLGECTEKYISLAAEADSIWSERMMLLDAWPKD